MVCIPRCTCEEQFDEFIFANRAMQLDDNQRCSFWGFDSVGPGGMCQRVYAYLTIPSKAWPGLLKMPDVAGGSQSESGRSVEQFVQLVRR